MADDLLERELRDQLHRSLGPAPHSAPDWPDLARRLGPARRRRRHRRVVAVAAGVVLVLVSVAVVVSGPGRGERVRTVPLGPSPSSSVPSSRPSATPSTGSAVAGLATLPVHVLAQATVSGGGVVVAGSDGSAWVAVVDQGQVVHVGPTGQILSRLTLPSGPGSAVSGLSQSQAKGYPIWLASGEGHIWALSFGTGMLTRIDPTAETGIPHHVIPLSVDVAAAQARPRAEVERVAAGLGHVWVTVCCDADAPNQRLVRVDPTTLAVDPLTAALPGDGESETPVAGTPGLFVTGEGFDTVAQVDPVTMKVVRLISVPGGAGPVTLGSTAFVLGGWSTATSTGTALYRLDPSTHLAVGVAGLSLPTQAVAATGGPQFWGLGTTDRVAGGDWVIRLSGSTASVVSVSGGTTAIAPAPDGSLWYSTPSGVTRIGPSHG